MRHTGPSKMRRIPAAAYLGLALVILIVATTLVSIIWTPYDLSVLNIDDRLMPPSPAHPLGTDPLGRDLLTMLMIGGQTSLIVALAAVAIGLGVGAPLGLLASAYGGVADEIVMRMSDIVFAFPALIFAILLAAVFGPGAYTAVIAIGIFNIPVFARLTRGAALPLWTAAFVLSARTAGKSRLQIATEHILPNIAPLLAMQATIQFSLAILAEAGLSYIGLGVQPPAPSWGRILAENQTLISVAPWLSIFPGLAIFVFVLSVNLASDGLRRRYNQPVERLTA
ncbi:MAG: ABC transporter permease [Pseudomonadota bacterium]